MVELSEFQIDVVSAYIRDNGVAQDELHDDLLDHVCTSIENRLQQGDSFEDAFHHTIKLFGPGGLMQVQQDTFQLLTQMNETMKKVTFGFGLTSTFLLLAGTIFKLMHWPGANVMVLVGTGLLVLAYLPIILTHKLKESPKGDAPLHIAGFVGLALTSVGVLFKVLHWPGASVMLLGGMSVLAFGYVPIYFFKRYKTSVNRPITLSSSMVSVACLILIFALMKTGSSIWYEQGVMLTEEVLDDELKGISEMNIALYASVASPELTELKAESDKLVNHLEGLKLELMARAAHVPTSEAANVDINSLEKKHDLAVTRDLLLGIGTAPRNGQYSALELKAMFESHRARIIDIYPQPLHELMLKSLSLRTDGNYTDAQGEPQDWLHHQFGNVPLFTLLTNLTKWQLDIRQMENQVLLSKISQPEASNPPS